MTQEKKKNPHQGHRDRMRERIKSQGVANMPQHEILEFLLYPFVPMKDTNPIAHELIDRFGSLEKVFDASPKLLEEVKNMTESAALYLTTLPQVFKRYNLQKFGQKPMLDTTQHAVEYFRSLFSDEKEEAIYMVIVNSKGMLLESCKIGSGNLDSCQLNTREFILRTANSEGNCILLAHNHPSGSPLPSPSDCEFTIWLISLAEVLGITLVDHLIIASEGYFSFRENDKLACYAGSFDKYLANAKATDKYAMKLRKFADKK